jgi:hypothetical protein
MAKEKLTWEEKEFLSDGRHSSERRQGSGEEYKHQKKLMKPKARKAYRKYQNEYVKDNYKTYSFRVSRARDSAVIERLAEVPNSTAYLKKLVIEDIKKNPNAYKSLKQPGDSED